MQPQSKIHALLVGVLLPCIALVMFFAHSSSGATTAYMAQLPWHGLRRSNYCGQSTNRSRANAKSKDKQEGSSLGAKVTKSHLVSCHISLVALSVRQGYASLAPEQLRHVNPDAVVCSAILLTLPLFALFTVHYSVRRCNVGELAVHRLTGTLLIGGTTRCNHYSFPLATLQRWRSAVFSRADSLSCVLDGATLLLFYFRSAHRPDACLSRISGPGRRCALIHSATPGRQHSRQCEVLLHISIATYQDLNIQH